MTLQDARNLIQAEAVDIFSIKVTKHGGIAPAKAICEFASAHGIQVFFNSMIEEGITQAASLQIAATCSNIVTTIGHAFFSPKRLQSDICNYHTFIKPEEGRVSIPQAPGLGIEMDENLLAQYCTGSVTVK